MLGPYLILTWLFGTIGVIYLTGYLRGCWDRYCERRRG